MTEGKTSPQDWLTVIYGDDWRVRWAGTRIGEDGAVERLRDPEGAGDRYAVLSDINFPLPSERRKVRKSDVEGTRWLWADFDPPSKAPESWREAAFQALTGCDLIHYVIDSGRGFWAVSRLERQVSKTDGERLLKAYSQKITEETGLEHDRTVCEISRIVRLPGTTNSKTNRTAQYFTLREGSIDPHKWLTKLKNEEAKAVEEYTNRASEALETAIKDFNNIAPNISATELISEVENPIPKPEGEYLTWAVADRTSKSTAGLTYKISTGRFHIHSETLSRRFGITDPNPESSYDLLDLCVMSRWGTGGPQNHPYHGRKRVEFLKGEGRLDEEIPSPLEGPDLMRIASGLEVPDRLSGEIVNIWKEHDWLGKVRMVAQRNRAAPSAVLMGMMVRTGASAGGSITGGVTRINFGRPVSLALYVVLSGSVGSGKTLSNSVARDFCPLNIEPVVDGINVVSAAGLAETYIMRDEEK